MKHGHRRNTYIPFGEIRKVRYELEPEQRVRISKILARVRGDGNSGSEGIVFGKVSEAREIGQYLGLSKESRGLRAEHGKR